MAKQTSRQRIGVRKTYKLYIGGKFPRSESGRSLRITAPGKQEVLANIAHASRKDLRDAVVAAKKAFGGWSQATPFLRGQILYRAAEMLETRKAAFTHELQLQTGATASAACAEVEKAVDRLVWYAGWADKFVQCFGAVNPVAAPYFNFTVPEPMGVVGLVAPDAAPLVGLVSKMAPAIISGNTTVVIASEKFPLSAMSFGEVLATSDLPGGVVNVLTGQRKELLPHMAKHMGVNGIDYSGVAKDEIQLLQEAAPMNVKRIVIRQHPKAAEWLNDAKAQSPYWIADLCEMKTAWHPIGV